MDETIEVPRLDIRASFDASTLDADRRTVEIVWSTGAKVRRGFFGRFDEVLSLDPKHIRLGRINSGRAPFLESHGPDFFGANSQDGLNTVIGVIEKESARLISKTEARALVRFSKRERADELMREVGDGILGNVSVGYRIHKAINVTQDTDEVKQIRVVDWEPMEVSLVAIGADAGAGVRSEQAQRTYPCVIEGRKQAMDEDEVIEGQESTSTRSEGGGEPAGGSSPASTQTTTAERTVDENAIREEATRVERERVDQINKRCAKAGLPESFAAEICARGITVQEAADEIIDEVAKRRGGPEISSANPSASVSVGAEDRTKHRSAIVNGLLHRFHPQKYKVEGDEQRFAGMRLEQVCRHVCESGGVNVGLGSSRALFEGALTVRAGGMTTTSELTSILANVANKTLRDGYDESPQTFQPFVRMVTVADFKEVRRTQLAEAPQLLLVNENGEYERGPLGDAHEAYRLKKYGRIVAISYETIVNDDLDALTRVPNMMGRQARNNESDLVYAILTSNPTMGDGTALFHADHGNLGSGAIGLTGLDAMRVAMRTQKGLDGTTRLNIQPRTLVVPAALETKAQQEVVLVTTPNTTAETNPFRGTLQPVAEPRLDEQSASEWFAAADPGQIDTIELAHLQGEVGPTISTREGFEVDGVQLKIRHSAVAKAIDWRGFYKSTG
ncbi:MAG: peptidase U37 [bacterium]|nr:peptidase U37 [bacterium]